MIDLYNHGTHVQATLDSQTAKNLTALTSFRHNNLLNVIQREIKKYNEHFIYSCATLVKAYKTGDYVIPPHTIGDTTMAIRIATRGKAIFQHPDIITLQETALTKQTERMFQQAGRTLIVKSLGENRYYTITDQIVSDKTIWQLQLIPLTGLEVVKNNPDLKALIKACFELDEDAINSWLENKYNQIVSEKETEAKQNLRRYLVRDNKHEIERKQDEINGINATNENLYKQMLANNKKIKQINWDIQGLLSEASTADELAIKLLTESKTFQLMDINKDTMTVCVKTTINNYATKDMESYFRSGNENAVTQHEELATALKATFVEGKYKLLSETVVNIPINGSGIWHAQHAQSSIGNMHMVAYNCYSQAKTIMSSAMQRSDYTAMLNTLGATCATMTLADYATVRKLCEKLYDYKTAALFVDKEGNRLSVVDIYEKEKDNVQV